MPRSAVERADPLAGWRAWALGAAFWTAIGLLMFSYQYLDVFVRGRVEPFHEKLIEELTGSWGTGLLAPAVFRLARRLRHSGALLLLHLPALLVFSTLHTSWNWGSRTGLYQLMGLGEYDYGIMRLRYAMEFGNDVIVYGLLAGFVYLFEYYRSARERDLRFAELEAEVARARLQALEARLHPHFLFNALHTVSSVMYDDVQAADAMLARLSDLLRRTLRTDAALIPLEEELETTALWLEVMRARFGDRLRVRLDVDPGVRRALIPPLLLQPFLENAVKHGDPGSERQTVIAVRATRTSTTLRLDIRDNGPGLTGPVEQAFERGVGLGTTRRRLEAMYDGAHRLVLSNPPDGGLLVTISLPWREAAHG